MNNPAFDFVIELHQAFWKRQLTAPIVNIDCSLTKRFSGIPPLPARWLEQDDFFLLQAESLVPNELQPEPIRILSQGSHPLCTDRAFHTLCPYHRIPWLGGIVGCPLKISKLSKTVWPEEYLPCDWYEREDMGLQPCMAWMDKLLEFIRYIRDHYYPEKCIPTMDMVVRGPGDLALQVLGTERFLLDLYDHPEPMKKLLGRLTDIYLEWGKRQLDLMPEINGGFCNQYGIWSAGSYLRTQVDYAVEMSPALFREFILPCQRKIYENFDYVIIHTHSGFPDLIRWVMKEPDLNAIDVVIDPTGPTLEESIALWNEVLDIKPLILSGPVTQRQLDMLTSELNPSGLWLDIKLVTDEDLPRAWDL